MGQENKYINIYKCDVTKGGQDGELVSQNDLQTNPIEVSLDAVKNESKYIKCAIRTMDGYVSKRTAVSFIGLTQEKWEVAKDEDYASADEAAANALFKKSMILTEELTNKNVLFWLKATATVDEKPAKDMTVSIKVDSNIVVL